VARQAGIDEPGGVRHIIARGIGRDKIFRDDQDRDACVAMRKGERVATGEALDLPGL